MTINITTPKRLPILITAYNGAQSIHIIPVTENVVNLAGGMDKENIIVKNCSKVDAMAVVKCIISMKGS